MKRVGEKESRKRRKSWNAFSSFSPSGHQFGAPVIRASRSQTKSHGFTYYDLHPCPLPPLLFLPASSYRLPPRGTQGLPFCLFPSLLFPPPLYAFPPLPLFSSPNLFSSTFSKISFAARVMDARLELQSGRVFLICPTPTFQGSLLLRLPPLSLFYLLRRSRGKFRRRLLAN